MKVNTSINFRVDEDGVLFVDPQFLIKRDALLKQTGIVKLDVDEKLEVDFNTSEFVIAEQRRADFNILNLIISNGSIGLDGNRKLKVEYNPSHLGLDSQGN